MMQVTTLVAAAFAVGVYAQAPTTMVTSASAANPTAPAAAAPAPAPAATPAAGNPFAGVKLFANPYYASEVNSIAVPSMEANPTARANVNAAKLAAEVPSFFWMDAQDKVKRIPEFVEAAKASGGKSAIQMVVYDLPDRDCSALASNGEFSIAEGGAEKYKGYIDSIKKEIEAAPDMQFILVVEPDSLGNLVTNMNVPKCQGAKDTYLELTDYAIKGLNLPNVAMYLDAGHAGWLGWPANLQPAADIYAKVYKDAGSPKAVRGLATNVANYNAFEAATCPSYAESNQNCDEKKYINAFAPLLKAAGFPAQFIVDTGRNGAQPTKQQAWGNWCNVIGTGFGVRPTSETNDPLVDGFVWIKPGGECDGTSNSTAPRFDSKCASPDALQPAPQAGQWFQAYFEQLVANANPKLE
ncbi:glycoside hydrolase family 6 protein [Aulographum hederae CBS 113979]|uniref:Glucanase n=1 Tax=Aulographum hederae CBS 113979 TaxID=1176131 RepID=A0A6G1GYH1_9PEZI|nr:glycoside hydrolase family 6 protein [Aulographum hederae CBS 113979]